MNKLFISYLLYSIAPKRPCYVPLRYIITTERVNTHYAILLCNSRYWCLHHYIHLRSFWNTKRPSIPLRPHRLRRNMNAENKWFRKKFLVHFARCGYLLFHILCNMMFTSTKLFCNLWENVIKMFNDYKASFGWEK